LILSQLVALKKPPAIVRLGRLVYKNMEVSNKTEIILPDKAPALEAIPGSAEIKTIPTPKPEKINPERLNSPQVLTPEIRKPLRPITPSLDRQKKQAIEKILATGLESVFIGLEPGQQQIFKRKGEETVSLINQVLKEKKINPFKIAELIKVWLRLVPGSGAAFIEKDAKIKLDKIMNSKI